MSGLDAAELERRLGFHVRMIEASQRGLWMALERIVRTPEWRALPGAEVRKQLMGYGLTEQEAITMIVEAIREGRGSGSRTE